MDWTTQIDGYCERLGPGLWAEPLNAVTNLAFIIAAVVVWPQARGLGRVLAVILFAIGVGSGLFHTFATAWASLADTLPIALFIILYLYAVHRDALGHGKGRAALACLLFVPYAAGVIAVLSQLPFFTISAPYWAVPILLVIYGALIPRTRNGFWTGASILSLSITLRSLDSLLCNALPFGTHFLWHLLNALMLAYMIHVHARLSLAGQALRR